MKWTSDKLLDGTEKRRILLVEDEQSIADAIQYSLSTEGLQCRHVTTGLEALQALRSETFHLIVLDVGLPDVNGFELCKEIRRETRIPLFFLTARSEEIDRVVGLEIGADDFIAKPFSPRELTARIKVHLQRWAEAQTLQTVEHPPPTTSCRFQVDEQSKQILWQSRPISLSRYEFRLLKYFLSRPGRVFSREQLLDAVWDDPSMCNDRTVDSHIKSLRAKLKSQVGEDSCILTHRGFGYSFKDPV